MLYNTEKIRVAYKSARNFKHENQIILLMITDGKKWHYLTLKNLSALLREIKMALSYRETLICITQRTNIKSSGRLLFLKLFSLIHHKKTTQKT